MSELALQLIAQAKKEGWTYLDLGNCGLTQVPEELFELDNIKEIVFSTEWCDYNSDKFQSSKNTGEKNQLLSLDGDWNKLQQLFAIAIAGQEYIDDLGPILSLPSLYLTKVIIPLDFYLLFL